MTDKTTFFSRMRGFLHNYFVEFLGILSIILFCLSFYSPSYEYQLNREIRRVERSLQKRQRIVEQYALKALNAAPDEWMDFPDLPEDMVIYKYNLDTLQSWVHEFPIGNDEINVYPFTYKLQFLSNNNIFNSPLAYVGIEEQYVNLGSDWYVINKQLSASRHTKIITGVRVKTENPFAEKSETMNPMLRFDRGFTSASIAEDDAAVVNGIEGSPLFSLVNDNPLAMLSWNVSLKWLALLLAMITLFVMHFRERTWRSFLISVAGLALIRMATVLLSRGPVTVEMFSPILYASSNAFASLGDLLLNNLSVALLAYAVFLMRGSMKPGAVSGTVCCVLAPALGFYIHEVLESLILNSNLVLEPYRLSDLSFYTFLCYASFALLTLALLQLLQTACDLLFPNRSISLFSWRSMLIYTAIVALFFVVEESRHGLEKEYDRNRVATAKLASVRDVPLELHLRSVEHEIADDPFMAMLASANGMELIKSRMMDRYFNKGFIQRYNITITLCNSQTLLNLAVDTPSMPCVGFFARIVDENGILLDDDSAFFYINNPSGGSYYLGIFNYPDPTTNDVNRVFLEIEPKFREDPLDIFNLLNGNQASSGLSRRYSSARYIGGRLVSSQGSYNYPVVPKSEYEVGYTRTNKNGYMHFVNRLSEEEMTVVSRRMHGFLTYVISFSYIAIFFGIFFVLCTRWARKDRLLDLPKHSLRRKITFLTTGSIIVALAVMAFSVVSYTVKARSESNRRQMEARIDAVTTSLSPLCKYVMTDSDLRNPQLLAQMESVSQITKTDINLFDVHGVLIFSTKPELFSQNLVGTRMNGDAFHSIAHFSTKGHIGVEKVGNLSFQSTYAPLFNDRGDLVAIANVPYISSSADINAATASTVAMIVNLYLLLIIAAVIIGMLLSNAIIKPLWEVRGKLSNLTSTGKEDRHIEYHGAEDELGVLIQSYNKMVDDLDESSRRLAQSEREQAWKEMARQIAHEIKNPLTPMRLSIQYLMRLKEQNVPGWEDKVEKVSQSLLSQIDILSDTASEFSAMAKSFKEIAEPVDLDEVLGEQITIQDNSDMIKVEYLCIPQRTVVLAHRRQMARVFTNLLSNAIQAVESSKCEGIVRATVEDALLDGRKAFRILVEDSGPGVDKANLGKLFTPDFTTKSSGNGLGLFICKNIIEQTGGTITYHRSESLGGACFSILLLAYEDVDRTAGEVEVGA